jgi:hypothetical protein
LARRSAWKQLSSPSPNSRCTHAHPHTPTRTLTHARARARAHIICAPRPAPWCTGYILVRAGRERAGRRFSRAAGPRWRGTLCLQCHAPWSAAALHNLACFRSLGKLELRAYSGGFGGDRHQGNVAISAILWPLPRWRSSPHPLGLSTALFAKVLFCPVSKIKAMAKLEFLSRPFFGAQLGGWLGAWVNRGGGADSGQKAQDGGRRGLCSLSSRLARSTLAHPSPARPTHCGLRA